MTLRRFFTACVFVFALGAGAAAQQPPQPQDEFVPVSELPPHEQLPAAPLLVAAYVFAWVAIGAYVVSVGRRLSVVQREIERLEADIRRVR